MYKGYKIFIANVYALKTWYTIVWNVIRIANTSPTKCLVTSTYIVRLDSSVANFYEQLYKNSRVSTFIAHIYCERGLKIYILDRSNVF